MNCKPNDLAIVLRADAVPLLIGQVVQVLEPALVLCEHGPAWVVRFQAPWFFPCGGGMRLLTTDANCPDAWLRPVSGLPVHDEIPREVTA